MKITAFEGNKGDCVLLSSSGGRNVLVDGGHVTTHQPSDVNSYKYNVAPSLGAMREAGGELDLVCVSHIDQDHIGGVLIMLDDEFSWRVHEHQKAQGLEVDPPDNPRPPKISRIWHNSFHEQLDLNRGEIDDAIAAAARGSLALQGGPISHGGNLFARLVTSMREAAQVSRRIGDRQLNIPLNPDFNGKLAMRRGGDQAIEIGDLKISVLGPTGPRLAELCEEWNEWLESSKGQNQIARIRADAERAESALINGDLATFLASVNIGPAIESRSSVTEENVASIIMMVEEDGKTVLMTGDARDDHIVEDLIATGFADGDGHVHLDVLKLQHHGSEKNYSIGFGRRVTADHYLICGNGKHKNPDLRVIERIIESRLGPDDVRSPNAEADQPFKMWFTSDGSTYKADQDHMRAVDRLVGERASGSGGRLHYHFSGAEFLEFTI